MTIRAIEGAIEYVKDKSAKKNEEKSEYMKKMMTSEYKSQRRDGVSFASAEMLECIPNMYESFKSIVEAKGNRQNQETIQSNFVLCLLAAEKEIAEEAAREKNRETETTVRKEKGDEGVGKDD